MCGQFTICSLIWYKTTKNMYLKVNKYSKTYKNLTINNPCIRFIFLTSFLQLRTILSSKMIIGFIQIEFDCEWFR